jgi:hypothetical protein
MAVRHGPCGLGGSALLDIHSQSQGSCGFKGRALILGCTEKHRKLEQLLQGQSLPPRFALQPHGPQWEAPSQALPCIDPGAHREAPQV